MVSSSFVMTPDEAAEYWLATPTEVAKAHKEALVIAAKAGFRKGLRELRDYTDVPIERWRFARRFFSRPTSDGTSAYAWFGLNPYPIFWVPSAKRKLTPEEHKARREKMPLEREFGDDFNGPDVVYAEFEKNYNSVFEARIKGQVGRG